MKEMEMEGFWGPSAHGARRALPRRAVTTAVAVAAALLAFGASAWAASGTELCMPKSEGAAVLTPRKGKCKKNYTLTRLGVEGKEGKAGAPGAPGKAGAEGKPGGEGKAGPEGKQGAEGKQGEAGSGLSAEQVEQLKALLPHITLIASGIGGKPTIRFAGVNVQIVNGTGKTATINGEGNLVIGYDENKAAHAQTGSHDLILGEEQTFTSYAGVVAGFEDAITAAFASVTGGGHNSATFKEASVTGGFENTASKENATVSGGRNNAASGEYASVSGGRLNTASGFGSSIFGGKSLTASAEYEAIP
jgi:hypothetical protein